MTIPALLLLLPAVLLLTGCESLSDATGAVRSRLASRDEAKVRTIAAQPREVYDAVKTSSTQMGYRFVRGGPAQGEIEAVSSVRAGDTHGSARQLVMKVKLRPSLDAGSTEMTVRITEIIEADSSNRAGQATEQPLRDTPQYEVLFQRVGELLGLPKTESKKAVDAG